MAADELIILVNNKAALPRFAALNAAWIKELHHMEASDKRMVAEPELYIQNENYVFSAHIDNTVAGAVAPRFVCMSARDGSSITPALTPFMPAPISVWKNSCEPV